MDPAILMLSIISPIAGLLLLYKLFNHGRLPCVDTSQIDNLNKVAVENV